MEKLPVSAIFISAFVAGILWLFAQQLEQQVALAPAPPPAPDVPAEVAAPVVGECADVEQQLRGHIDVARQCTQNSDCMIFDYGYPLQCMMSVAKSQVPTLRGQFARYHEACEHRVYYDCPTGDAIRIAVCRNNICSVDVVSENDLADRTLDHLGIQD